MNPLYVCLIIISSVGSAVAFITSIVFVVNYTCDSEYIEARIKIKEIELKKLTIQKQIANEQHLHDQKMIGIS